MTRHILKLALAAATCMTAACATAPVPPSEASLSFASPTGCTETISADAAELVTIKKRQSSGNLVTQLDLQSACQIVDGAERPYALYKLPGSVKIANVQAGGVFQAKRLFAAEVLTLDENLTPVRSFGPESFLHRGGSWSAFFQARENERYIAVRANPDLIGDAYGFSRQMEGADSASSVAGHRISYSYEGPVFARVFLAEPAPVGPKEQ